MTTEELLKELEELKKDPAYQREAASQRAFMLRNCPDHVAFLQRQGFVLEGSHGPN